MSVYSDLLRDRRWQQKRLEVLEAAGWVCQSCGSTDNSEQLHVHHKRYVRGRKPWEYGVEELEALCKRCHDILSGYVSDLDAAVASLKMLGFSGEIEQVTGFIKALVATTEVNGPISVKSYEEAMGVHKACGGCDPDFVLDHAVDGRFDASRYEIYLSEPPVDRTW